MQVFAYGDWRRCWLQPEAAGDRRRKNKKKKENRQK
jgi:hypothetical protein